MKIFVLFLVAVFYDRSKSSEFESNIDFDVHEFSFKTKSPIPEETNEELPVNFTWSNVNGKNYLTLVRNQHIPNYCGGCYAFASTSSLSDRIKITRGGQWPDIIISPQVAISCSPNRGCHGGSPSKVYEYIQQYGITDETCSPYRARGHENGAPCTDKLKCSICDDDGNCHVPESYPVYYVEEHGHISGEKDMLNEIYHRGPIACSVDGYYIEGRPVEGIITDTADQYSYTHIISVFGFGEENGVPFWYARNSWGSFWADNGFFKVLRGKNSIGIEHSCHWAVPKDTWTTGARNYTNSDSKKAEPNSFVEALVGTTKSCIKYNLKYDGFTSKSGNFPWNYLQIEDLPQSWDWRNVSGENYVSWTRSQNGLNYCASCWVEAATSTIADRIMVARKSNFPQISLSIQVVINCQAGGDCDGGDPLGVFEFAYDHGIPEDSCQNYIGKNPESFTCSGMQICKDCVPPAPRGDGPDPAQCTSISNYRNWKISDYGIVSGIIDMKKAIYNGGPIACGIHSTSKLDKYSGGVFSQFVLSPTPNHEVSVVGWGVDENETEYWIVRNSWGTHWGEMGFFRIKMGQDNLGIEKNCIWAQPITEGII